MAGASFQPYLFADASAIVAHLHINRVLQKMNANSDQCRIGMSEGVRKRLAADAVHLITHQRMYVCGLPFAAQFKSRAFRYPELCLRVAQDLDKAVTRHGGRVTISRIWVVSISTEPCAFCGFSII